MTPFNEFTLKEYPYGFAMDAIPNPLKMPIFNFGGVPKAHEGCCVTMYNEKVLNSIQIWLPGFSAMCHYTKFGIVSPWLLLAKSR